MFGATIGKLVDKLGGHPVERGYKLGKDADSVQVLGWRAVSKLRDHPLAMSMKNTRFILIDCLIQSCTAMLCWFS